MIEKKYLIKVIHKKNYNKNIKEKFQKKLENKKNKQGFELMVVVKTNNLLKLKCI